MKNKPDEKTKDKFLGCLLGLALGDALGAPLEFHPKDYIAKKYVFVDDFIESDFEKGEWTDDTAQMLAIAESYIEYPNFNLDDIVQRFVRWYLAGPKDVGIQTSQVLSMIISGMEAFEASRIVWEKNNKNIAGNGALMRCCPTALARINDTKTLIRETESIAKITHFDPRCVESCVLLNVLIADIITDNVKPLDDYSLLLKNDEVLSVLKNAPRAELNRLGASGYTLDTLALALWAYSTSPDYKTGVLQVMNLGDDADTNAAVTGAILGAKYGASGIPQNWLIQLMEYSRIETAALRLLELAF